MSTINTIADGMARALFVSAYASAVEEAGGSAGPGVDWKEVAPETPIEAVFDAGRLVGILENVNGCGVWTLYARACDADGDPRIEADVEGTLWGDTKRQCLFGLCLALEAIGHGVSWFDDHAHFTIEIPDFEANATAEAAERIVGVAAPAP